MKIYIICSVRNATEEQIAFAENYVRRLEHQGHEVHYPPRDTDQTDDGTGLNICISHRDAMEECDEVHVLWDKDSKGSHVDFGMAFAHYKPIVYVDNFATTPYKSYGNVIKAIGSKINEDRFNTN